MTSLANRGRARPLTYGSTPVGSIDLTEDFHPVNVRNAVEPRLWVFGALSEGVRYFTGYIPSPKSRVRAFLDAELCANEIIGSGRCHDRPHRAREQHAGQRPSRRPSASSGTSSSGWAGPGSCARALRAPGRARVGPLVQAAIAERYRDVRHLYRRPPTA